MNIVALGSWLASRLQEPSTWAGLAGLSAALGFTLPPGIAQNIAVGGTAIGGLLAAVLKEKSTTPTPTKGTTS